MNRCRLFAFLVGSAALCATWITAPDSAICQDVAKKTKPGSEAQHCQLVKKDPARMPCKDANYGGPAHLSQQTPIETGPWQLTRTPSPSGGPDSISISKIADAVRSDQGITGLMLRCAEGATTEVLVILIEPLPPQTHPKVTVVAGTKVTEFTASVVTRGALVLLPEKASALVEGAWQSIPELGVTIAGDHRSLHGVIPLADIRNAMQILQSNCSKRGD